MANEIESRYLIPDHLLFDRLLQLDTLAEWRIRGRRTVHMTDLYLDTPGKALLHQGWACRLRSQGASWVVNLKGPKELDGAVVTRPEFETTLRHRVEDVTLWPAGPVRDKVLELTGGLPLRRLVTIKQTRHRSALRDDLRPIAEVSLDEVSTIAEGLRHESLMLECELIEGAPADLQALDGLLVRQFALAPESRSKLRRALDLIEHAGSPDLALVDALRSSTREELATRYGMDSEHGQLVANVAERLAVALGEVLDLTERDMRTLAAAAWLHDIGEKSQSAPHHVVSRDVLLRNPLENTSSDEQCIVAMAAYLHRKKISSERLAEMLPEDWSQIQRRRALEIAALVRMAAALDKDHSKTTSIHSATLENGIARILLSGPSALADARRAQKRSDLWDMVSGVRIEWGVASMADGGRATFVTDVKSAGINPWDSMPEAARKTLAFHYQRMLKAEPGTRTGEDPEDLHDMRVATRRMRSALRLFKPFIASPLATKVNADLRGLGQILGTVRDMDVAQERAEAFLESLPLEARPDLSPILAQWARTRERGRARMLSYLDRRPYESLQRDMEDLFQELQQEAQEQAGGRAVARVTPRFLYVDWRITRGYDDVVKKAPVELLHQLRIDCKRLRYGLEFMRDVLPPKIARLIPEVVRVQDHLGEMHDAAVAVAMLDDCLARHRSGRYDGVRAYREALVRQEKELLDTFPKAWKRYTRKVIDKAFDRLLTL